MTGTKSFSSLLELKKLKPKEKFFLSFINIFIKAVLFTPIFSNFEKSINLIEVKLLKISFLKGKIVIQELLNFKILFLKTSISYNIKFSKLKIFCNDHIQT